MPAEASNALEDAVDLAEIAGLILDPWQRVALGTMLGERAGGLWAAAEVGLVVPRQNGKGGVLEARVLYELFVVGASRPNHLIIWTAHEFKTAQEAFLRMKALITNCPALDALVEKVRSANGEEGFVLRNGARLRFLARGKNSGRGFSADLLVLDEALVLPAEMIRATLPTLSARPNPQIVYASTAPQEVTPLSAHLLGLRRRAVSDDPGRLAWAEWSLEIPDSIGPDELRALAADRAVWAETNPALGFRLTEESIDVEFRSMVANDLDGFLRERLGVWPAGDVQDVDRVISIAAFDAAVARGALPGVRHVGPVTLAVDGSPTVGDAAIVAVGQCSTGGVLVELVAAQGGVGWVAGEVARLLADHPDVEAVVWDERGPLRAVAAELADEAGEKARPVGTDGVTDAAMRLVEAFDGGRLVVAAHPAMSEAVANATARAVGNAWAIERWQPVSVAPVVAGSLGLWAFETSRAEPVFAY